MRNNKGFSLIELSIVLIILGLLVAGVTGGASLIKSAQIRSVVTELNNYRNAYNTYYAQEDEYLKVSKADGDASDPKPWEELADKKIIDKTSANARLDSSYKNAAWSFDETNIVYGKSTALAFTDRSGNKFLSQDDAKKILTKTLGDTNPTADTTKEVRATGCAVTALNGEAQDVSVLKTGADGNEDTQYMLLYRLNLN